MHPRSSPGRLFLRQLAPCLPTLAALPLACSPAAEASAFGSAGAPILVAHRGDSGAAPENTMSAVRSALALEPAPTFVEIDVWRSADGALVVIHDEDTERTAGRKLDVRANDLASLRELDVGYREEFGTAFAGERIPVLEEVLDAAAEHGAGIMIEIKDDEAAEPIARLVARRGERDGHVVASFSVTALRRALAVDPELHTLLLEDEEPLAALAMAAELGCAIVGFKHNAVTPEVVARVHEAGRKLWVWTVNEGERARELSELGADAIITDEPAALRRALDAAGHGGAER